MPHTKPAQDDTIQPSCLAATLQNKAQDPLYADAAAFVRSAGKVSVAIVQRKFRIGYNRASSLIDKMEADGVITGLGPTGNRSVVK